MEEALLIARAKEGDATAFGELVKLHQQRVFRTAMGILHHREDAEEIAQDVFVQAFRSLHHFRGDAAFSTWLYRITLHAGLNLYRQRKRSRFWTGLTDLFSAPAGDKDPGIMIDEVSEKALIRRAIDSLPQKQRMAFVLARYEELSQKEVAAVLRTTEGAVEQLLIRATANLRKKLEKKVERP